MRVLSDSEVPQLMAAIRPGEPFGERDQAMLRLLQLTGFRASEFFGLLIGDVSCGGRARDLVDLRRELAKGGKARLVPLNGTAKQAVQTILAFNARRGFSVAPGAPLLVNGLNGCKQTAHLWRNLDHVSPPTPSP